MSSYLPNTTELSERLEQSENTLVLCFCAAWCDACKEYRPKFDRLSMQHPEACFVWVDIEDHPDLLGDEDIENFPTIAIIKSEQVRFLGTILPHIAHLDRLIVAMRPPGQPQTTGLPEELTDMLRGRH